MALHGVTMSGSAWQEVAPLLPDTWEFVAPTALGHRGGPLLSGKATITRLVDTAEETIRQSGGHRWHIVGNSIGGWMALELARRGHALSVLAISPAGCWTPGKPDASRATDRLISMRKRAKMVAPLSLVLMRIPAIRRFAMRDVASHADRLNARLAIRMVRDLVECDAADDLLATTEWEAGFDPPPCPLTFAWGQCDRIFPVEVNGAIARARVPQARWLDMGDLGHVPMIDDPAFVARTIVEHLQWVTRASTP
nr:alpha/beta hydrolase [Asaia sp. As-1742]